MYAELSPSHYLFQRAYGLYSMIFEHRPPNSMRSKDSITNFHSEWPLPFFAASEKLLKIPYP